MNQTIHLPSYEKFWHTCIITPDPLCRVCQNIFASPELLPGWRVNAVTGEGGLGCSARGRLVLPRPVAEHPRRPSPVSAFTLPGFSSTSYKFPCAEHLPSDQIRLSLHLPSEYKPNHFNISRVTFIFWTVTFIYYLRPPPLVRSKVQIKTHLLSDQFRQSLHLPSKYEPNHLYISRVIVIFWTAIFIYYLRPPLVRSKVQTITHLPSNKNQTLFSSPEYLTAGSQFKDGWVCVTTGEGAGGATWPLAKHYTTLACGHVAPPAPCPVVTHTLPSLD